MIYNGDSPKFRTLPYVPFDNLKRRDEKAREGIQKLSVFFAFACGLVLGWLGAAIALTSVLVTMR